MTNKITRQYGGCEVTLSFNEKDSETMDKIMWLLIESYCERMSLQIEQESHSENKIAS